MAVAALVCGVGAATGLVLVRAATTVRLIESAFFGAMFLGLFAAIFGWKGLSQCRESGERGRGFATVGLTLGLVAASGTIVMWLSGILLAVGMSAGTD